MHEVGYIRISRKKLYPLTEILFVVLCGSICGAESWRDFVLFSESKIELLKEYYPFSNGIACKDTFARVFAVLDPEAFKSCFVSWVKSLQSALQEVIAIDGKTINPLYIWLVHLRREPDWYWHSRR